VNFLKFVKFAVPGFDFVAVDQYGDDKDNDNDKNGSTHNADCDYDCIV